MMDPNAALAEIRRLVNLMGDLDEKSMTQGPTPDLLKSIAYVGMDLTAEFGVLDDWISKGGFLPDQWSQDWPDYTS